MHELEDTSKALGLVAEVLPVDGQRILHLRSVFKFTNNTSHDLELLTLTSAGKDGDISQDSNAESYIVKTGQDFHVPFIDAEVCF